MITRCPHCGHNLSNAVSDGITSCSNCNRVFDTSPFHRILAASWLIRRQEIRSIEKLMQLGYKHSEALLAMTFVFDNCFSHEEFVEALNDLGVSKSYQVAV